MRTPLVAILLLGTMGALAPADATEVPPPSPRYSMSPTDGGFVRLDTVTGEMAFCKRGPDNSWACETMAEGQNALRKEVERLERENSELRNRSAGVTPPAAPKPPGTDDLAPPPDQGGVPIPTEQDVDRMFDYLEGMAKKLKERWKRLEEQEGGKGTPL
jgi:hypothetical protein